MFLFTLLLSTLFSPSAHAFPEMVRHGYINCIACHVSPTGGGLTTAYGRELSKEVLSTWSKDGEQELAYGLIMPPSWLNAGGDYRELYLYQNTPTYSSGQFIYMQADLEAAVTVGKFTGLATVGYQDEQKTPGANSSIFSRQHWLDYKPTDEFSLRAGKFETAYGLNIPDHYTQIKKGLGWDQGTETYNVEGAYIGDEYNAYVTGVFGRPDNSALNLDKGVALTGSRGLGTSYKVGASYFYGESTARNRNVFGPWAILGFRPDFFLLSEIDFQNQMPKDGVTPNTWGAVDYQKLGYEAAQGLIFFLTQEFNRTDFSNSNSLTDVYGFGLQFLPRPHFELSLTWELMKNVATSSDFSDYAFIQFHYYL